MNEVIVNNIISFIETEMIHGQGVFAFSMKGINKVCVVVMLYLMRKYLWTFNRCLEYLKSKKRKLQFQVSLLISYWIMKTSSFVKVGIERSNK